MPPNFRRKNIRLRAVDYLGRRLYFLTLCFHKRQPLATNSRIAKWLIKTIAQHAARAGFAIHAYCIMPDHIHLLTLGLHGESDLRGFVEHLKARTGFEFAAKTGRSLWQFKYYDHIVRNGDPADGIAVYIWMNPVRKALCHRPQEYPFSGSCTDYGRKMFANLATVTWIPPWKAAENRLPR